MTEVATIDTGAAERLMAHVEKVQRASERLAATRSATDRLSDDAHVYFIQRGTDGPVKIGCSTNVARRFWELQTASPEPLRLIGLAMLGGYVMERRLHRLFATDRISGEWFQPSQLLAEIAADTIPEVAA